MSCKVCPDYAKDYKNEFLFIRGIDKCFKYYLKNLDKATSGVFKNRVGTINKFLRNFDRLKAPNNPLNEIDEIDVGFSVNLLEQVSNFTEFYMNERYEFDLLMFANGVDGDFPGWTELVETVKLFHAKFKMVKKYSSGAIIKYDESDDKSDDSGDEVNPFMNYLSDDSDDSD